MNDLKLAVRFPCRIATFIAVALVSSAAVGQFTDKSADLHSLPKVPPAISGHIVRE